MKRTASRLILPLAIIIALATIGCTRNNGNIGPVFGLWKLTSIETSGCTVPMDYEGNIFWGFQNSVIMMTKELPYHQEIRIYGNFTRNDDRIAIDFPDNNMAVFPELGLPRLASLNVIKLSGSEMILEYHPSPVATIEYRFKKWD